MKTRQSDATGVLIDGNGTPRGAALVLSFLHWKALRVDPRIEQKFNRVCVPDKKAARLRLRFQQVTMSRWDGLKPLPDQWSCSCRGLVSWCDKAGGNSEQKEHRCGSRCYRASLGEIHGCPLPRDSRWKSSRAITSAMSWVADFSPASPLNAYTVEDIFALSRRKQGFESPRERQKFQIVTYELGLGVQ